MMSALASLAVSLSFIVSFDMSRLYHLCASSRSFCIRICS